MAKNDDDVIESLIAGGLIGAELGALLSKNKEDGATLGGLAGAVILATLKASENAQKTNVPLYIEENGIIYELSANGDKKFIKKIPESNLEVPKKFKLK
jgi:hypothetical protein